MDAIEALDVAEAESLVCQAQRARMRDSLQTFSDVARPGEAFEISFGELSFQERSNDGNRAVVHVSGTLTILFLGQQETQEVNEDHIVIKQDGRWVVCDP